jgi:hypothetical protein
MANKINLSEDDQKKLLMLKSSYDMHAKTREECVLRGKNENVDRINAMLRDIYTQMYQIDPDFAKKCAENASNKYKQKSSEDFIMSYDTSSSIFDELNEDKPKETPVNKVSEVDLSAVDLDNGNIDVYDLSDMIQDVPKEVNNVPEEFKIAEKEVNADESIYNDVDINAQYDLIPLPSKGECYKNKINRVPVGYLTASDENLITSPNLYESGSIINILLKKKILNKNINVDELVSGDVDAIMLFLRGTSYGNEFPIIATDPTTGKKIEATIDLSTLKYKSFSLKGDENGYFDFTLPKTKKKLKFKFLTKKEERLLQKLNKNENKGIAAFELDEAIGKIKSVLQSDKILSDADKNSIIDAKNKLEKWSHALSENKNIIPYSKSVTNTMEMEIVSVDGNMDKKFIHDTVMNMPASDSLAFRRYVYDNQPGVDFEVDVERPESMGGGSFKCFLEWDDTIFWHIA